ncbi:kinase-like domain-containing protein [Coniochaeta sp. 2T2.1]|nr:kinase-like domain-containing protein [Coniochaeta sp. 2T2.1]
MVEQELDGTPYACSSLRPLAGGNCNFIYHGVLLHPLPDGTREVVVKHGEDYVGSFPDFKVPTSRCQIEEDCLSALSGLPPVSSESCVIRSPRFYHFNPQTNTQIQEYLPNSVNLKTYAINHLSGDHPAEQQQLKSRLVNIGRNLGTWLRNFHAWAADPTQAKLRADICANKEMQPLKYAVNYGALLSRLDAYPDILGDARGSFEEVGKMAEEEMKDEGKLQVIHGDFWTGNALISNHQLREGHQPTIFIVDWEMCSFGVRPLDLGQMIAELYELYLYKGIGAGLWLIEGFCAGYGIEDDAFAFRTALTVGTHLVAFGNVQGWGTEEQVRGVIARGKEIIVRAWGRDREWFVASDLASLFER